MELDRHDLRLGFSQRPFQRQFIFARIQEEYRIWNVVVVVPELSCDIGIGRFGLRGPLKRDRSEWKTRRAHTATPEDPGFMGEMPGVSAGEALIVETLQETKGYKPTDSVLAL